MKRTIINVTQGGELSRSTVRIENDPSEGEGSQGFLALGHLLNMLTNDPNLLRHASDCPNEVKILYDGVAWVIESTTVIVKKET